MLLQGNSLYDARASASKIFAGKNPYPPDFYPPQPTQDSRDLFSDSLSLNTLRSILNPAHEALIPLSGNAARRN
jgi:hypothetical protein